MSLFVRSRATVQVNYLCMLTIETLSIDRPETWLKVNVRDNYLMLPGYNLERLDRKIGFHEDVCLYYKSKYIEATRPYNL